MVTLEFDGYWSAPGGSATHGLALWFDPSRPSAVIEEFGNSDRLAFPSGDLVRNTPTEILFARYANIDNFVIEDALQILKNGPGSNLPQFRYTTAGFLGRGHGIVLAATTNRPFSQDRRYWFGIGSRTKEPDLPTAGSVQFSQLFQRSSGYFRPGNVSTYDLAGMQSFEVKASAAASVDFTEKVVHLALNIQNGETFRLPLSVEIDDTTLRREPGFGATYAATIEQNGLFISLKFCINGPDANEAVLTYAVRDDLSGGNDAIAYGIVLMKAGMS
ncbi:hypothetical protein [Sphingomonas japonica]|uniref:Uncharacterized protein n=1 Tax=Sphingomonas japonica TaxID=511662 RepID=A0ABX0U560_9SPHN|nr:hypothetical protein [Sphingomonas japonica]NIJ23913.1 hypothetical protein [Sphingomonas japonica]